MGDAAEEQTCFDRETSLTVAFISGAQISHYPTYRLVNAKTLASRQSSGSEPKVVSPARPTGSIVCI
jgi:hypothetical protein